MGEDPRPPKGPHTVGVGGSLLEGVRLGRPATLPDEVREDIRQARRRGSSYRRIAEDLNSRGIPTAHGGARWHASTVQAVLRTA